MSVLLESVTFTDVLGHHTISLEKFDVRELDPLSKVPTSVKAWIYVVTERHNSIHREADEVRTYASTVTRQFLQEEDARGHFQHVYRDQNGKETIYGVATFQPKAIGNETGSISVHFIGATSKTFVMTMRAYRSLCKLTETLEKFDIEFLYYTSTSIADDVIVIGPSTN